MDGVKGLLDIVPFFSPVMVDVTVKRLAPNNLCVAPKFIRLSCYTIDKHDRITPLRRIDVRPVFPFVRRPERVKRRGVLYSYHVANYRRAVSRK